MKADGTFALTDPTSRPEARMKAMAEQTGAQLIVASEAQSDLAQRLTPPENSEVVIVSSAFLATLTSNPIPSISPQTTALPTTTSPLYI